MIRNYIKTFLKKNKPWFKFVSSVIYFYLKFVYLSSKWHFIWPTNSDEKSFANLKTIVFAMWHDRLAFGPGIFKANKNTAALVSPHSDGKLISSIITNFDFEIIEGSSNKNPRVAIKGIIQKLSLGSNVVITPDGPRGPRHKVKGSTTNLARKYGKSLIPIACSCTNFALLKSWDRLVMPLPFSKIIVLIGEPIALSDDTLANDKVLEQFLIKMTDEAEDRIKTL